jgi:HSP20 family protein
VTLMRWYPTLTSSRDFPTLRDEMYRMFDTVRTAVDSADAFVPAVDIEETADAYVLRADLPGVASADVKVTLLGDVLTIRGERRPVREAGDGVRRRLERTAGTFERSFRLGRPVFADRTQASFRDGVLEVRVPKADEARVREIEVRSVS